MTDTATLTKQLHEEIIAAAVPIVDILDAMMGSRRFRSYAKRTAAADAVDLLTRHGKRHLVANRVLYRHGACPPNDWWQTPAGLIVAEWATDLPDVLLSQTDAAEILGVTRGTVSRLVHNGDLPSTADGIPLRPVLRRLVRLKGNHNG